MNMLRFLSFLLCALPLLAIKPGPRGGPMGMPQVSPEQYQQMMTEVDQYLSSLSEDDINKMVQEAMKDPGFQQFVKDVEEGKITPEDIFGPGPVPGALPPPVPTPQAPKPTPQQTPEPVVEKPHAVALRSPAAAMEMLKLLIATINERLIPKAEGYHRVADVVRPWYKRLNTLTYYLSTLLQPEHIHQLVTDKAFLALHDALQKMSEKLNFWEPKVQVQELGEEEVAPAIKEQSKKALSEILHILQNAFDAQQVLAGLEQLFKKYEPEILKRRKTIEEIEETARKSADSSKYQRMSPARVEREGRYARPTPSFYDWWFEQPEPARYEPYRGYDEGRSTSRGSDFARPSATTGAKAPTQPKKEDGAQKAQDEAKKKDAYKPVKPTRAEMPSNLEYGLNEIERSAELISKLLADNASGVFPPNFGGFAPSYILNAMNRAPAARVPGAGPAASTDAFTPHQLEKIGTFNSIMKDLSRALHHLQSKRGEVEYAINKIPDAAAKQQAAKRLTAALEKNRRTLHNIYNATLQLADKPGKVGSPFHNYPQMVLHYGIALDNRNADRFKVRPGTETTNVIPELQQAYELVYGGDKSAREAAMKAFNSRLKAHAGEADVKHGAAGRPLPPTPAGARSRVPHPAPPLPPIPPAGGPVPGLVLPGG
jgi:hypothetical protein